MSDISLKEELTAINKLVNPIIDELLTMDVSENNAELVKYQCSAGGKGIRPALLVISGQLFGANRNDLLYPAASVEILHNATLIIDDIIDHSDFRRDQPTCWKKFGQSIAECTAFFYISPVFAGLTRVHHTQELVNLFSKTLKIMVDGEIKDILFERSGREDEDYVVQNRYKDINVDDYLEMVGQKTAILLKTCCQAGAICADADRKQIGTIGEFGYNLGMAFQVRDDMLDIFGDEKELGKKIGKDIVEKKMGNYVILSAMEELDLRGREVLQNLFANPKKISDADIKLVTGLIGKTKANIRAEDTANKYIENAFKALETLPQNEHNQSLQNVARYVLSRKK